MPPKASVRGKKAAAKKIPAENKKTVAKITDYILTTKGIKQNKSEMTKELISQEVIEGNFNNVVIEVNTLNKKKEASERKKVAELLKDDQSSVIKSNGTTEVVEDAVKTFEESGDSNTLANSLCIETKCPDEKIVDDGKIQLNDIIALESKNKNKAPTKRGRKKLEATKNVGSEIDEICAPKVDPDNVEKVSAKPEEMIPDASANINGDGCQFKIVSDIESNGDKVPIKRGRKKLDSSKKVESTKNYDLTCDSKAGHENVKTMSTKPDKSKKNVLNDEEKSSETDNLTIQVNSTLNVNSVKQGGKKDVASAITIVANNTVILKDSDLLKVDKTNDSSEVNSKTELLNNEVNCLDTQEAPLKRGRKKVGDKMLKELTIPCEDPKTEVQAPAKRGRKKAILPVSEEPLNSKKEKIEKTVTENASTGDKDCSELTIHIKNVKPETKTSSGHLEQNNDAEEKIVKDQPDVKSKRSNKVVDKTEAKTANKKLTNKVSEKQETVEIKATSNVGRKRKDLKDEPSSGDYKKAKSELSEADVMTKTVKVCLKREKKIEELLHKETTKIIEKGGVKNTKASGKRARNEEVDPEENCSKPLKIPKKESKGQSKNDPMPDASLLDFGNTSVSPSGNPWNFKVSSWNVNGVRAWLKKKGLAYVKHECPDIICFQETKCSDKQLPEEVNVGGYHSYWLAGDKDGYSGVGILTKKKPISIKYGIGIKEHDSEGRVITAEYENFYLVTAYIPNAGRGLVRLQYRMQWDKDFRLYVKSLDDKKPVVLCGDLNVAHKEIDLANPKTNHKNAGFTKEERDGFSNLLADGFIDSFRYLYPEEKGVYTFWTYMMNARAKNVGWRLDYFVLSKRFTEHLCDSVIRKDVFGSDHCPITLFLSF